VCNASELRHVDGLHFVPVEINGDMGAATLSRMSAESDYVPVSTVRQIFEQASAGASGMPDHQRGSSPIAVRFRFGIIRRRGAHV
jgi:hypothetical protein